MDLEAESIVSIDTGMSADIAKILQQVIGNSETNIED